MNFDVIENLSTEDVLNLYDSIVERDFENSLSTVYAIANCVCKNGSRCSSTSYWSGYNSYYCNYFYRRGIADYGPSDATCGNPGVATACCGSANAYSNIGRI